ncbi:phage tail tape measure protein [Methylobacterium fujisawaense]|uniref:phage tail tape measure protein n=1 Tax=Methylobacterium fujisawaense TaxID=107400 RepID=UPI0036FEAFC5
MASKTIEAKLVISGEDRASSEIAKVVKAMKDAEKASAFSDKVERLGKAYTSVERQMRAATAVMSARGPLEATVKNLAAVERETTRLAKEYDTARKAVTDFAAAQKVAKTADSVQQAAALGAEVKRLGTAYRAAEKDVKQLSAAFSAQTSTLRAAESAASKLGVDLSSLERHQTTLARQTDLATRALKAQVAAEEAGARATEARIARSARRREALGTIAAGAGVLAAHEGKKIGLEAVNSAAAFDIAVRKQKVYTDISETDQAALLKQATKIGQETQFSNIDVVHAQTAAMQGLPAGFAPRLKAEVAQGIIDNVRNFSTLMDTDLKEGAETIRSYLQATGKDISTKERALQEANKATNQLVKMAKLGGMNGEDVSQYVKFAAAPGTAAGVSTESLMSLGALARRGGLRGDEAGVFIRSVASHLVSPTNKGHLALAAAGMRHSDYVSMPDRLSTSALEGAFQLKIGKGFTPEIRRRLDAINANKDLLGDQGRYTAAVVEAAGGILGKDKKGKVRASDAKAAAKAAGDFYRMSAGNVDVERLLDDAMAKNMTLAQLNALFTDKHGGKGAITQRQWDEFKVAREEIKKSGNDPDFAKKKADYVFAGVGGSVENLKGSFENLVLQIGNANAGLIKWTADLAGNGIDLFSSLSKEQQQALSLGGGAAALGGGAYGAYTLTKTLLGFGGGAVALNGSAVALNAAAAALTEAAVLQGAKGAAGALPEVAKKGGKLLPLIAGAGVVGGAAAGIGYVLSEYGDASKAVAAGGKPDPGVQMNPGDELPGLSGSSDAPSWVARKAPSMTLAPGAMPLTIQGTGIGGFGLSGPVNPEAAGKEAGEKVGTGVADGIKAKAGEVIEQGRSLLQKLNEQFREGIFVPINFAPGAGMGGSAGGGLIQRASFSPDGGGGIGGVGAGIPRLGGGTGAGGGSGGGSGSGGSIPGIPASVEMTDAERNMLGLIQLHESHGRNTLNYVGTRQGLDPMTARGATAQGYFQILNSNWRRLAPGLGIKTRNAMSSTLEEQTRVALALLRASGGRPKDWAPFNPALRRALARGDRAPLGEAVRKTLEEPRLVRGMDGKEGLDLGDGTMRMPDGAIRSIPRGMPEIPEAPAGGIGGGGGRGMSELREHVAELGRHIERFGQSGFHGQIEVTGLRQAGLRATSLRVKGRGGLSADMGITEMGAKLNAGDPADWS